MSGNVVAGHGWTDDYRLGSGVSELSSNDLTAIILALMRIEEKLDALLGEDDDDGEEEADA